MVGKLNPPLATGADREFLLALRYPKHGRMTSELSKMLGVSESAVRARASRLRELWFIEVGYTDRFAFYSLTSFGWKALGKVKVP